MVDPGQSFKEFEQAGWESSNVIASKKIDVMPVAASSPPNSTFEVRVNQKTARAIGLTIPQTISLQADRVIE